MRNGVVYELPTQGHPITDSGSLSLPTLPTTRAQHGEDRNNKIYYRNPKKPQNLENALYLVLPTVTTQDAKNNAGESQFERNTLPLNAEVMLLGTPRTSAANASTEKQVETDAPKSRIEDQVLITNWGKFEPAIRRWEALTRPAPAPTKPDGKDDAHRLSAEFTEWMMGLREGWVTAPEIGLKRNNQLKACGNGVVPQQAEMALRILLQDLVI
jgi:phage/plasmid-associated DNA primase